MRGFIFACTNKSEKECLDNLIFATNKAYGHRIFGINKGDYIFLYNLDTDALYGTFEAEKSLYDKSTELFGGKYPYLVKVKPKSKVKKLERASKIFKLMGINWRDILTDYGAKLLSEVIEGNLKVLKKINKERVIDKFYRPPLFSTTLWDFPKQSYGDTPKGNNRYPGVTPAFIIYNLIHRYTEPGDFIFIDSPYSDNIRYNEHPKNIGHIPATDESFFDELEKVMKEAYRVLKQGKYLAWLIGDQWANEHNFYLRGFKYLLIFQKERVDTQNIKVNIRWNYYERERKKEGTKKS